MLEIRSLKKIDLTELKNIAGGYSANSKYAVALSAEENRIEFNLELVNLIKPYVKKWDYDDETLQKYQLLLDNGYSFGAFADDLLVGMIIAEPYVWNNSLWVWEFHVIPMHQKMGIGKRLMATVVEAAKTNDFRTIVCETQNTNVSAIKVYRRLGFRMEGIDISYYSNLDYPDGEIAIFMKLRLN